MTATMRQLGELVREFRASRGFTQLELASALTPITNRSLIAHLEQGIRVPPPAILARICRFLGVPEGFWTALLTPAGRGLLTITAKDRRRVPVQMIAVSGISGSGKSTLARAVAAHLGIAHLSGGANPRQYLRDLEADPQRWAAEAQIAFFSDKAVRISKHVETGRPLVVDRTLTEDAHVYARYFEESGKMEPRGALMYKNLAEYFMSTVPLPDVVIYCKCDLQTAIQRIAARGREDTSLHSNEYLSKTLAYYEEWLSTYDESPVLIADSLKYDWRSPEVVAKICSELEGFLYDSGYPVQMQLFETARAKERNDERILMPASTRRPRLRRRYASGITDEYPLAYVAAPFTGKAEPYIEQRGASLFSAQAAHGRIPSGRYRKSLLAIERTLRKHGIYSIIPHRDVNKWGKKHLMPKEAMQYCTQHVRQCDLLVAVLGQSAGAHYEFGLARGLGKPCIVIHCGEIRDSFLATGLPVAQSDDLLVLRCKLLTQIPRLLAAEATRAFFRRHFDVTSRAKRSPEGGSDE